MHRFFQAEDIELRDLESLCNQAVAKVDYPHAAAVEHNVVIYDRATLVGAANPAEMKSELAKCLSAGPGVFIVRRAFDDSHVLDRSNELFREIAAAESRTAPARGDHFGDNQRIWNSLQKTCIVDPQIFVAYYSNPILHLAAASWLGPGYRMTAQVNNVRPGGEAQAAHRDYHLGFQSPGTIAQFPLHAQTMSSVLTLQGAIAHTEMPCSSGPTLLLPFSHQYPLGYLAAERPEFANFFEQRHCQLPLSKGDALFFNPALFHAGGANHSDQDRIANLLQISSAMGRTMESVNHRKMIEAVYPVLRQTECGDMVANTIAAVADGYSFPTNLDSDPPIEGKAPVTEQEIVRAAVAGACPWSVLADQLDRYYQRRTA